ncbi:hypothetical protein FBR02_06150 [Anaerolineae bacterium CFX9]|nr:hypothetical protein [Anaerolineae bacterium CFX9]
MDNILAVATYGAQRVKHPQTQKMISAYKMGYSSAASAVLLALYGDKARDVSSKHASYHYIQVDGDVVVRHGYILLKVSSDLLRKAETITRRFHRAAVFLWRDGKWCELPTSRQPEYTEPPPRSGPDFNPSSLRLVDAASGEKDAAVEGIIVEKSQRDPHEKAWFWIMGDTYPHRELLKRWGCRWSKKRRCWYYIGWALPSAIEQLVQEHRIADSAEPPDSEAGSEDDPCTLEEAANILGVTVKPEAVISVEPPRLYALNAVVYARHDLETPDGKPIPTGTRGIITRLYNRNARHGWSYDVQFDCIGEGWYFERELTDLEPIPGICITRGAVVPPGVELPPTDADIKRSLIEMGQHPEALPTVAEATYSNNTEPPPADTSERTNVAASIRVLKPQSQPSDGAEPDAVQTAIQQVKAAPMTRTAPVQSSNGKKSLIPIPHQPVGELTGSISGNVWCYGYSIHEGVAIYLNLGGPRMAVEAIRARLAKGEIVNCVPWDAPAVELTAGEGNTGMYTAFLQNIPEAKFTSLILLHEQVMQPNYGGKATTFIPRVSDDQATMQLKQHVTELVKVPVFDVWADYLYHAGQSAMLVRKTRSAGGLDVLAVDLDVDAWTRLLTGGLEQNIIALPVNS